MILKYLNIDGLISSYLSATLSALALFSSTLSLLVSLSSMSSAVTRSAWAAHTLYNPTEAASRVLQSDLGAGDEGGGEADHRGGPVPRPHPHQPPPLLHLQH